MVKPQIRRNMVDRVIDYVDPLRGARRLQARAATAMLGATGYIGADRSRRATKHWNAIGASPDVDQLQDLPTLRARSRSLLRDTPLALGAINTNVTSVVGSGLMLKSTIDADALGMSDAEAEEWQRAAQREFRSWAESPFHFDVEATLDFYSMQALAFRSTLESGDTFTLLPYRMRAGGNYGTKVQLLEGDRVCNPNNKPDDPDGYRAGIKLDADGMPMLCAIADRHPGDYQRRRNTWQEYRFYGERTGRRNVIHLFEKIRPGQRRGMPYLAPVIEPLKQLAQYSEAEIMAAVISGMFTVFIKRAEGGDPDVQIGGEADGADMELGYGAIGDLGPGEEVQFANPGRPNASFDPFVKAILQQVGVGLQIPMEVLIKHFSSSYSAARAALLEAWRFFKVRRQWLASSYCQPIYEVWLAEAVSSGRLSAPGFFKDAAIRAAYSRAEWMGDGPGSIDPQKEVTAIKERIGLGLTTLEKEAAQYDGSDWRDNVMQRGKEVALMKEQGVTAAAPSPAEPPNAPADPAADDEEGDDGAPPGAPPKPGNDE